MNRKKIIMAIICWAVTVLLIMAWTKLPTMGENIMLYKLLGCVALFLFLMPTFVLAVSGRLARSRRETTDGGDEKVSVLLIAGVITGILFLFLVGPGISVYLQDKEAGPQRVVLHDFKLKYISEESAFQLGGTANGVDYTFEVKENNLGDGVIRALNEEPLEVAVTHYPYSMSVVKIEVYTADGYVLIVSGEGQMQVIQENNGKSESEEISGNVQDTQSGMVTGSTQSQANVESTDKSTAYKGDTTAQEQGQKKDKYEEIPLEEAELTDIQAGEKVSDVNRKLMQLGFREELISGAEGFRSWGEKRLEIMKAYDVTEEQAIHFVYKGDVEAIMIYNKETHLLENLITRKKVDE